MQSRIDNLNAELETLELLFLKMAYNGQSCDAVSRLIEHVTLTILDLEKGVQNDIY